MNIKVVHRARTEFVAENETQHLAVFEADSENGSSTLNIEETLDGKRTKVMMFLSPAQWAELSEAAAVQASRTVRPPMSGDRYMTNDEVVAWQEENRKKEGS